MDWSKDAAKDAKRCVIGRILGSYVKVFKASEESVVPVLRGNAVGTGHFYRYKRVQGVDVAENESVFYIVSFQPNSRPDLMRCTGSCGEKGKRERLDHESASSDADNVHDFTCSFPGARKKRVLSNSFDIFFGKITSTFDKDDSIDIIH
ncbi:hypothetical protein llap_16599 [Limosa lapponica baueri]|uniref:Uncharacterized protein n=1 Tax=Limosa lapponica baueri TaxID=1758121 RepID=A0A2I0TH43_LIMLA|nr:hypothetical protein llap_16599 [Limosa lapponica baueri]